MRPLVATILAVAGLALGAPGKADSRASERYVVAAIGDSLTDPRAGGGKYLKALARRCPDSRFDAYGVGGQRTDHMRWRFTQDLFGPSLPWLKRPHYTHVIVLGGVNDLAAASLSDARIDRIKANLSSMYRLGRQRGLSVVGVTVPPWGRLRGVKDRRADATRDLNEWIVEQAKAHVIDHAVEVYPLLSCGDPQVLCPEYRRFPSDQNPLEHRGTRGRRRGAQPRGLRELPLTQPWVSRRSGSSLRRNTVHSDIGVAPSAA